MRSYARNQGAQTPNTVLVQDISVNGEASMDAETVASYLNVLRKIFVVEDMPAGNPNMRSKTAIRSSDTRYYVDPSIAATALESGPAGSACRSQNNLAFFLKYCVSARCAYLRMRSAAKFIIIADKNGLECDTVIHLRNGTYGLVEIKLGGEKLIEEGSANLRTLSAKIDTNKMKAPAF